MSNRYTTFLRKQNIKDFQERLTTETDPEKRDLINRLLAEERAKRPTRPMEDKT